MEGLTRLELSVRGILRNFGLKLGQVSTGRWEERVRELTADNAMLSDAVGPILRLRRQMRSELAMMTKKVRSLALSDATCRLLMTMPGVGPVTALAFVTAVDGPSRFRRARDIGAWAGLTPKRSQSGERDVSGEITRTGDAALRTALFQAATSMLHASRKMNWLKSRRGVARSAPRPRWPDAWPSCCSGCGWTGRSSGSPASRRRHPIRHEHGCTGSAAFDEEGRSGIRLLRGGPPTDVPSPGRGPR